MSTLRIAFCVPTLSPDATAVGQMSEATSILQEYIAAGLRDRGHALTMVAPEGLGDVTCLRSSGGLETVPRTWSRSRWFRVASGGAWRLQRFVGMPYLNVFSNYQAFDGCLRCLPGHDLVYERNSLFRIGVAMACRHLRLPYLLFFDADEILEHDVMGSPLVGVLRWRAQHLVRYNLRAADRVICVSAATKARLVDRWNVDAEKVTVFPNAVDVDRFRPGLDVTGAVRCALSAGGPIVIFVGGFYEWHDVGTLLDAFAEVIRAVPRARLVLVGDGAQRSAMAARAAQLGIDRAVVFKGLVPHADVPPLVSAADIAVAPYKDPGHRFWLSPLKLLEYMAAGPAVVASRIGQIADVITHGSNGILVPPGDPVALAAALRQLLENPGLRAQLARRARADVVQQHSWRGYAARLEGLCRQVVADRRRRARPERRPRRANVDDAA